MLRDEQAPWWSHLVHLLHCIPGFFFPTTLVHFAHFTMSQIKIADFSKSIAYVLLRSIERTRPSSSVEMSEISAVKCEYSLGAVQQSRRLLVSINVCRGEQPFQQE